MSNELPKLSRGPYLTPVIVRDAFVSCELRGVVRIIGLSDAPIPWPIGDQDGERALIVYKGLATALRTEVPEVIAAWWGVSEANVRQWQLALQAAKQSWGRKKRLQHTIWQPSEIKLLLSLPPRQVAKQLGRPLRAVKRKRHWLGAPDARGKAKRSNG